MKFHIDADECSRALTVVWNDRGGIPLEKYRTFQMDAKESYELAMDMLDAVQGLMFDKGMAQQVKDLQISLALDWERVTDPMPHERN